MGERSIIVQIIEMVGQGFEEVLVNQSAVENWSDPDFAASLAQILLWYFASTGGPPEFRKACL